MKLCIVVIFFNPNKSQLMLFDSLASSYKVIGVDNSLSISHVEKIQYIPLLENKGIAYAQNVGIREAKQQNYDYILFVDQDSKIDEVFINKMYVEFVRIKTIHPQIAYLGPVFVDERTKKEYKNYLNSSDYCKVDAIISSGSLISLEAIDSIGEMDESLFIDLVDFEWCWRAISKGFLGFMTRNAVLYHSIGDNYHRWGPFVLGISSPSRYYYQYRNTIWLLKRCYIPLKWKVKTVIRRLLDIFIIPMFSDKGLLCIKYIFKGVKDGIISTNVLKRTNPKSI